MLRHVAAWADLVWAVEGSNGAGRALAQRLLADGESVGDVPAKPAARARMLDTGHGRKTDAHDAHSVAVAAVRAKDLRVLALDPQLESLRMLADRREELARARTRTANRLRRLLAELMASRSRRCRRGSDTPRQRRRWTRTATCGRTARSAPGRPWTSRWVLRTH